jgi:hypothetical protein
VEVLEGRALLSSVSTSTLGVLQVQPTGIHTASVDPTATAKHPAPGGGNVGDALSLGGKYTKALFAPATGTVIADYTKALLRGNTRQIHRLGKSSAVQQTNTNFANVGHSSQARAISRSFDKFGHNVAHQFDKIFG